MPFSQTTQAMFRQLNHSASKTIWTNGKRKFKERRNDQDNHSHDVLQITRVTFQASRRAGLTGLKKAWK